MIVSLIVAMDKNQGIGKDNSIPWHLSSDLQRFKKLTMGRYLIVGRKTFESIGKPLTGRKMVVVTRNPNYQASGCLVAHSLQEAIEIARSSGEDEVFIGGGAELFSEAIKYADRIYITEVHAITDANIFFPIYDSQGWEITNSSHASQGEKNQYPSTFKILDRIRV